MVKDPKKIAPKAFEYRFNSHKKTSTLITVETNWSEPLWTSINLQVIGFWA